MNQKNHGISIMPKTYKNLLIMSNRGASRLSFTWPSFIMGLCDHKISYDLTKMDYKKYEKLVTKSVANKGKQHNTKV